MIENTENYDILFRKLDEAKAEAIGQKIVFPDVSQLVEIDIFRQMAQDILELPTFESITRS